MRRRAILMVPEGQRPHPGLSHRHRRRLHDAADHDAIGEHVEVVVAPLAGGAVRRRAFKDQRHADIFASVRPSAAVIRTRVTSVCRPPATVRSGCAVASLALINSTSRRAHLTQDPPYEFLNKIKGPCCASERPADPI